MVGGLPLGESAVRDVAEDALSSRLQWMLVMTTHPDLVGTVHRFLATIDGPSWVDPTLALASDVRAWQPFKKRYPAFCRTHSISLASTTCCSHLARGGQTAVQA